MDQRPARSGSVIEYMFGFFFAIILSAGTIVVVGLSTLGVMAIRIEIRKLQREWRNNS
jgi:hypothetical protein